MTRLSTNITRSTLIDKLKETISIDDETCYLFMVKNCIAKKSDDSNDVVSGYMPRGYQFGFIYKELNNSRTIAHELGHGVNVLHHTFSKDSESFYTTSKTDNLMDYDGGTALNHKQWQWSHEKHRNVLGFLDDEEESEAKAKNIDFIRLADVLPSDNNIGNRYGFDDMDTADTKDDDHVCLKEGDYTYVGFNIKTSKTAEYSFVIKDNRVKYEIIDNKSNVKDFDLKKSPNSLIKISANPMCGEIHTSLIVIDMPQSEWDELSQEKREELIETSKVGQINIDVYKPIVISKTIYCDDKLNINEQEFNNEANMMLKYMVASSDYKFVKTDELNFDIDGNGFIDDYQNLLEGKDEKEKIEECKSKYASQLLLIGVKGQRDCWKIGSEVASGNSSIKMPNNYYVALKGAQNNEVFSLAKSDGSNEELFIITSIDAGNKELEISRVEVTIGGSLMSTIGMTYNVLAGGFIKNHGSDEIITRYGQLDAGEASKDKEQPVLVFCKSYDLKVIAQIAVHESMHSFNSEIFYDVNMGGNLMHYITSEINKETGAAIIVDITIPFRYMSLEECATGTGKPMPDAKIKSQWNDGRIPLNNESVE